MPSLAETATTTKLFLKGSWENAHEHRPAFAFMKRKGNVKTGRSGSSIDWVAKVGNYQSSGVQDYQDLTSLRDRANLYLRLNKAWAEELMTDDVSKGEFARQGMDTALVMLQEERVPSMAEDFYDDLNDRFFNSDDPTDNKFDGLESIFGSYTAGSDKSNKESGATLASTDTYAGQSTALNGISGVTNAQSDGWTPLLVNTGATWDSGGTGFDSTNAYEILSYGNTYSTFGNKSSDVVDAWILGRTAFLNYKRAIVDAQRVLTKGNAEQYGLGAHVEMVDVDGIPVFWDADVSASEGFGLNFDHIWMDVLQVPDAISSDKVKSGKKGFEKDIFDVEVSYDAERRGVFITATLRGQFRFNPRYQVKIADFSS